MSSKQYKEIFKKYENDVVTFTQELVRIKSYSDNEAHIAKCVKKKMEELNYDEVFIDSIGNIVGKIGSSGKIIHFDSHMDTVEVNDEMDWILPPFSAEIKDGRIYGRGSVDMKSALAASVYAAAIAKELGLTKNRTIYVTGSVCEEFCDGESIKMLYEEHDLRPDFVVICEPSDNIITLGHKGKAQVLITTHGVSAHGSAPEKGINAVYEMAEIITRVDDLNKKLMASSDPHGTVVLSDISCISASLNAVPSECSIYLDRRMALGETEEDIKKEMNSLIAGKNASWKIGTLRRTSWTGKDFIYEPLHEPWKIEMEHPLVTACISAYKEAFGYKPKEYDFWDFGTNAVTPVSMGIPTIGFGPGEYKLAHMLNENCEIIKIKDACIFYTYLIEKLN